jgi:hypothetical protein
MKNISFSFAFFMLLFTSLLHAEYFDPMQPPAFALYKFRMEKQPQSSSAGSADVKPRAQALVLNSILYSSQRQHAIINNKIVKKGDMVDGAKLIQLLPDKARLIKKGKVIELSLNSGFKSIKKKHVGKRL